ncbi:methylated-DNA--[protein]-cysteine S-methyltransferase [[Clostridium] leptum]|nr:methylated-DNA--[protein]-cysteine S-methyltransferase [[Clostridium] leptum]
MQYTATYQSPIGRITMASDGQNLSGLWFDGQKYFADTLSTEHEFKDLPVFEQTKRWLDLYFQGNVPDFTPSLYLKSSPFRLAVWDILKQIPYGKIITYGEIADLIAKKQGVKTMSAQAVGGAVGHNPISIIIPCHRVIGSNGSLTGYAGGLDKKISLLTIEKVDVRKFFIPKKRTAL